MPIWSVLGAGPMLTVLGRSWGPCWRSWAALGAYVGGLEPKTAKKVATMAGARSAAGGSVLSCSWGRCWRSWRLLEPLLALLGRLGAFVGRPGSSRVRSSVLCWRSWAALRTYVRGLGPRVGGLGPLLRAMLAVLAALGASVGGPGPSWAETSRKT